MQRSQTNYAGVKICQRRQKDFFKQNIWCVLHNAFGFRSCKRIQHDLTIKATRTYYCITWYQGQLTICFIQSIRHELEAIWWRDTKLRSEGREKQRSKIATGSNEGQQCNRILASDCAVGFEFRFIRQMKRRVPLIIRGRRKSTCVLFLKHLTNSSCTATSLLFGIKGR